jgi:hypothetical protein
MEHCEYDTRIRTQNTIFSQLLKNWSSKLECLSMDKTLQLSVIEHSSLLGHL